MFAFIGCSHWVGHSLKILGIWVCRMIFEEFFAYQVTRMQRTSMVCFWKCIDFRFRYFCKGIIATYKSIVPKAHFNDNSNGASYYSNNKLREYCGGVFTRQLNANVHVICRAHVCFKTFQLVHHLKHWEIQHNNWIIVKHIAVGDKVLFTQKNQNLSVFLLCPKQILERVSRVPGCQLVRRGHEGPLSYLVALGSWSITGKSLLVSVLRRTSQMWHLWLVAVRVTSQP